MFSKFRITVNDGNNFNEDKYFRYGNGCLALQKKAISASLEQCIDRSTGIIDGSKLEKEWFKEIHADVFLSHSHTDERLAIALAGWMNMELGLSAFVDSCTWGYADVLLNEINEKYNLLRIEKNGSKTYSHSKANYAASHVYLMLNSALNNMINKTECFMFIDTENSTFYMDKNKAIPHTLSPWIYSEVVMANTMKPARPTRSSDIIKSADFQHMIYEHKNISHELDFSDFIDISLTDLGRLTYEKKNTEHALDTLYRITRKKDSIYG